MAVPRVFSPDVVEKVARLCRLLSDIRIHPFLGPRLVLKGGTALNLFYLDVRRLSVDADLNYIGALDAETTALERPSILVALRAVAEGQGYRVSQSSEAHASSACSLAYRSDRGSQESLKLEVNYMYRVPLGEPEEKETRVAFEAPLRFRLVSFAELLGGKLVALLDRTAPRDLYDTAMLAEVVDVDDLFMRRVFVAMAGILPRALWEYSATRIERIENRASADRLRWRADHSRTAWRIPGGHAVFLQRSGRPAWLARRHSGRQCGDARHMAGTAVMPSASGQGSPSPWHTTHSPSKPRTSRDERIEGVTVGEPVSLISKPRRRPLR